MKFPKSILGTKIIWLAPVLVLLLITTQYWLYSKLNQHHESVKRITETKSAIDAFNTNILHLETGQRGYLLTSRKSYLSPFIEGLPLVDKNYNQLKTLISNDKNQLHNLELVKKMVDHKILELQQTINLHDEQGKKAALEVVLDDEGRIYMDGIQKVLTKMTRTENKLLNDNINDIFKLKYRIFLLQAIGILITIIILSWFIFAILKSLKIIRENEKTLASEREKFKVLFENSPDACLIMELEGAKISACNRAAEMILGGSREEILGLTPDQLSPEFQEDGKPSHEEVPKRVATVFEKGHHRFEWIHKRLNGEEFPCEVNVSLVNYEDRQILLVSWRDLTESKEYSKKLILEKERAERAEKAKSLFLANMSHEIRTPMNGILGLTQLLLDMKLEPDQHKTTETILRSSKSLLIILNDILDISKIEAGRLRLESKPFNVVELLNDIKSLYLGATIEKDIKLGVETHPDLNEHWLGDVTRIRQIISNLTGNAVKFTEKGEIKITAEISPAGLNISVSDTGIGIIPDIQKSIFEPFSQAEDSTSRKFGGTGLGLSICYKLTQLMNGEISLQSTLGAGSKFTVSLPLKALQGKDLEKLNAQRKNTSLQAEKKAHDLKGLRILVAEDNKVNQFIIEKVLKKLECDYVVARDGEEAVNKFKDGEFEAILMDIRMPKLNGMEATQKIRVINQKVPIIALTADVAEGKEDEYLNAGMNGVVYKPFDFQEIANALQHYCKLNQ